METMKLKSKTDEIIPDTLVCRVCKNEKLLQEFCTDKSRKYGVVTLCKKCSSEYKKKRRKEIPDKIRATERAYRNKNIDKLRETSRLYAKIKYDENPEKFRKRAIEYKNKDIDKFRENSRKRYKDNASREQLKSREFYYKNKSKIAKLAKERIAQMPDSVTKNYLVHEGFDPCQITPVLIEVKRLLIKTQRLIKERI